MKKLKKGRKFSREKDQRNALMKSLAREFFVHEKIKTTEAKAKESLSIVDKIITKAKKGDLNTRRILLKKFEKDLVKKIIEEIAPRYKDRTGGYSRIVKLGQRRSDGARMAFLELVKNEKK